MANELIVGSSFRLSAPDLPVSQRLAAFQDLFDSKVQLNFEAQKDRQFDAVMTVQGFPGLRRATMESGVDVRLRRSRDMLSDGEDDVCLIVNAGPALTIRQRRQQSVARAGDGVLLVYREAAMLDFQAMNYAAIRVPYAALAPLTRNIGDMAGRCIPRETAALRLLQGYLANLPPTSSDPQLNRVVANHVYDLMALAIGATRDGAEQARERGVRAARLSAIRDDILNDPELTIQQVAMRQGVTPRYVQMLFEDSGTTFTEFVLNSRLLAAHRMLTSPRFAGWAITAIAYEAGFGDLSYFNRRFKQRFGGTPSDIRGK